MPPPVAVSLTSRQDSGTLSPSYVLGPLIVSNAVAWAIWGMFTLHFILFVREVNRRRARKLRGVVPNSASAQFDWFGRGRRMQAEEERMRSEINPWTMSFAVPSISAYPSQARQTVNVHPRQHTRHRSSKSALSSSQDPYSPTSVGDQDSHSVLLPSHESPVPDNALTSSLWIVFLVSVVYILVLLRSVLSTVQFWRVAVQGWNSGSLEHRDWVGAVIADMTSPIVFMLVSAYYIYALFFAETATYSTNARHSQNLRPLSLLKHKMSSTLTSKVEYPASSPTSTAPTASRPGSVAGWKLAGLGSILGAAGSGSAAHRVDVNVNNGPARPRGWDLVQPVVLGLAALVVGACGIVETVRSLDTFLNTSTPLDAPSLVWFAGLFAFDFIICILLSRQLHFSRLWETSSWATLVAQALFEAGGVQLLVALLSMILVVVWRADKPKSTLPFVVPCILPSFSAFSALAHAARLGRMPYWCSASGSGSRYGISAKDLNQSRRLRRTSSRTPDIPKFTLDDIEMGGMRPSRDLYEEVRPGADSGVVNLVSRPSYPRERVVDLAAAQTATSSNSNTFSSDGTGPGQERTEDVVKQAMNIGADGERERERKNAEAKLTGLVLERDTLGSGSGAAGASEPPRVGKATSVMSGVSGGSALTSLELPVFRKGRHRYSRYVNGYGYEHDWDEESDYDAQSDELTFLTSEDEGGAWDYGFSNMEKEKEREERATNLAAAAGSNAVAGPNTLPAVTTSGSRRLTTMGRRISNRFSNTYPPASCSNLGEDDEAAEEADTVSVLSLASRRSSRRRSRRSFHQFPPSHPHAQRPLPVRRLLPVPPSSSPLDTQPQAAPSNHPYMHARTSTRASSFDSLPTPYFAPGSPAGSVLVISRSAARELSIAEPSIYHAASVAATRASTGSAFSTFSYTYPRPFQLPDLDVDLAAGGSLGLDGAMSAQLGSAVGGAMSGTAVSGASPAIAPQSPHPYAAVSDTDLPPPEPTRRRWNVHPLKRFAEMGRLKW